MKILKNYFLLLLIPIIFTSCALFNEEPVTTAPNSLPETSPETTFPQSTTIPSTTVTAPPVTTSPPQKTTEELFAEISNYKAENLSRYLNYYIINPDFTLEKVVTWVNIGLDFPYYTNIKNVDEDAGIFILVNKYNALSSTYIPKNLVELPANYKCTDNSSVSLVKEAADAFINLSDAAKNDGFTIIGHSGYRSYRRQEEIYNWYLTQDPKEVVDTYSARPGHSEHQTGLALDVETKTVKYYDLGSTQEYIWLKNNAYKYGFIIHYTEENEFITGYDNEEWHIRYVGIEAAKYIYENNISIDEYINIFF